MMSRLTGWILLLAVSICNPAFAQEPGRGRNVVTPIERELPTATGERRAELLFALISHYTGTSVQKAQSLSRELILLGREMKDPAIEARGLAELANLMRRRQIKDSAVLLIRQARQVAANTHDEEVKGLIDLRNGLFFGKALHDSSYYFFQSAYDHFRRNGNGPWTAIAVGYRGNSLSDGGVMNRAGELYDSAALLIEQVLATDSSYWPSRNAAIIANFQGLYHRAIGRYEESLRWNLKGLRFFETIGDVRAQAALRHTTGTTYRMLKNPKAAMEMFRSALTAFRSVDDVYGSEACVESIAMTFEDMETYDSAKEYFDRALDLARQMKNKLIEANIFNNMGAMYYEMEQYTMATEYYEKSLTARGGWEHASEDHIATAAINLGQTAIKSRELVRARELLLRGWQLARKLQARDYEKSALEGLIECEKAAGDFRKALDYQDRLIDVKDSLYSADSQSKIAEMQVQYETEKKEKEIALLTSAKQVADLRQTMWMWGLLAAVVVAALILYNINTRRARIKAELDLTLKEKERIQNELSYKDRELLSFATYITEKNDVLENVVETLNTVDVDPQSRQQLERLLPMIRDNINISGSREEFEAHLTSIYGAFIRKLEGRYPELTDYEKRLATLLRINLTSKQIASIFNISPKSVDMSRYRLRKKMGIPGDQDMQEVLTAI